MNQPEKKGFRRVLPLLWLAAVLLLAIAFVALLPAIKEKYPADAPEQDLQTTAADRLIAGKDKQTLQSITVSHLDGDTYTLLYRDGSLYLTLKDGTSEPINEALTDDLIEYATQIYVEETVVEDESEFLENLPDMGLEPPQIEVVSTFEDGSTQTVSLGYPFSTSAYYYYRWSGDCSIYLCYAGVYQTFEYSADMLLSISQPVITRSLVERVSLLPRGGDPIVCSFTANDSETVSGTLQSPFVYPMEQDATDSLLNALQNFRLGARLEAATEDTRAQYGLANPQVVVKITQREGLYSLTDSDGVLQTYPLAASAYTLSIGDQDGEFFYYCEVDGICYRASSFLLAAFLNADAMNYVSLHPASLGDETLQSITLQTGNGTLDFRAVYTENVLPNNELETDKNGNIVYTANITVNGDPITEDAYTELISRLQQMAVSGRLETQAVPNSVPLWQLILITDQGKTRTLTAYTMDSFSDILAVDGLALHYLSSEALGIALGEFSALLTQTESEQ